MKIFLTFFRNSSFLVFATLILLACSSEPDENPITGLPEKTELNLSYGTTGNQLLDIYLPAGRSTASTPVMIYIHGGAWVEGSKEEFVAFKDLMSAVLPDYAFVAINYNLYNLNTGANGFPQQENDVIDAVTFVLSKSSEWNISDKIVLAGASAGGHLALLHAYKHQEIGDIQAAIAFFPPTDLTALYEFSPITKLGLQGLIGGTPESNPEGYVDSSPVEFVDSESVPTLFFHGTVDTVVPISQSEILADALESAGVAHQFTIVPNEGHGFQDSTYPPLFQEAATFINSVIQ
ncbi:alpha/beta hydrolase [Algoriphagus halophytocola]|uniref:Alpha/beta hydrolase n=1 Tax=Algoriphagus halophytocola TaxID=2991499 RepID=A0ABY6MDE2_9BACT|nr:MULTISPECIES: alpha/beta hydrolase [unclassified Algoriphagus]UZD21771.1 alpha/beta hydrolase [Algoriphagus sp. TR-M5]WBL42983.1 alpha/beta hydrolase [Algoriphagus sp. TR-M9]